MTARAKAAHVWERAADEWYVEPRAVTVQLLQVEKFQGAIHDPCCGLGNIVTILRRGGHPATGSDLVQRTLEPWFIGEADFLTAETPLWGARNCVFNPPFHRARGTEEHIRRALDVTPGKVCAFTSVTFLCGSRRAAGLFTDHPPDRVWILTPRPSCPPGAYLAAGNKAQGGTADWCWLVWDEHSGNTSLGWLR